MKSFNKFESRSVREKEKYLIRVTAYVLGVISILYSFIEIISMLMRINYYIYTNQLFIFNQIICMLLFGFFLILLRYSTKLLKNNKMKKILEISYCIIGIIIIAISLMAIPNVINIGYKISFYIPLFTFFFLIGILAIIKKIN